MWSGFASGEAASLCYHLIEVKEMGKQLREVTSPELKQRSAKIHEILARPMKDKKSRLSLYVIRFAIGKLYRSIPRDRDVDYSRSKLGGTKVIKAELKGGASNPGVIVYIHGGAFMSGSAGSTRGYAGALAKLSGQRVYSIDYSLSPEVKYPVAFEECVKAVEALVGDNRITLVGDSAGANLCLAVALKLKGKISGVILNSPVVDFSDSIDRVKFNDTAIARKGLKSAFEKLYCGGHDPKDPFISPYFGDFSGFPPTFITCDRDETLYADSEFVYEKCETAGTRVEMVAMKGAFHAFAVLGSATPETTKLMEDYLGFIYESTT